MRNATSTKFACDEQDSNRELFGCNDEVSEEMEERYPSALAEVLKPLEKRIEREHCEDYEDSATGKLLSSTRDFD